MIYYYSFCHDANRTTVGVMMFRVLGIYLIHHYHHSIICWSICMYFNPFFNDVMILFLFQHFVPFLVRHPIIMGCTSFRFDHLHHVILIFDAVSWWTSLVFIVVVVLDRHSLYGHYFIECTMLCAYFPSIYVLLVKLSIQLMVDYLVLILTYKKRWLRKMMAKKVICQRKKPLLT